MPDSKGTDEGRAAKSRENDPASGFYKPPPSPHGVRAVELLERALGEVQGNIDAIPTVSEALANLRAEAGELSEDEAADLLDTDDEGEIGGSNGRS